METELGNTLKTPIGIIKIDLDPSIASECISEVYGFPVKPDLPIGMSVEACYAFIVKFRMHEIMTMKVVVEFETEAEKGYGSSGECLDSFEWESKGWVVSIGTEDGDCLSSRLKLDEFIPSNYPVRLNGNIVTVILENLPTNNDYSLHFVVAWNKLPEPQNCSCWFAVDIPHDSLLHYE